MGTPYDDSASQCFSQGEAQPFTVVVPIRYFTITQHLSELTVHVKMLSARTNKSLTISQTRHQPYCILRTYNPDCEFCWATSRTNLTYTAVRRVRDFSGDDKGADRGRLLVERGAAAVPSVTQALGSDALPKGVPGCISLWCLSVSL